jgi:hypothetical protein
MFRLNLAMWEKHKIKKHLAMYRRGQNGLKDFVTDVKYLVTMGLGDLKIVVYFQ